jgi:amphiphysin
MEDVIAVFNRDFEHVKDQVESINSIARGKTVHQPMALGSDTKSYTGLNIRNGIQSRRPSAQNRIAASPSPGSDSRVLRIPSSSSIAVSPPREPSPSPEPPSYTPDYGTHLTPVSSYSAHSPAGPSGDYFQRSAAQKKKPPPPPPKRIGSQNSGLYVTALYAFEGQSDGDLSFGEGEKIKVTKKTESTDDWWEGELRGIKGSFPANYCKPV